MRARWRLRFEILAGAAVVLAAVWAVIALMLYQAHSTEIHGAVSAGRNLARTLAGSQDASIRSIDLSLRLLREQWMRDRAGFDAAVAQHEEHLKKENVIQIAVVDRDGWTQYSRLPQPERLNFADREYFQLHRARNTDQLDISAPVEGRITGRRAIQVTRPMFDADGQFAGLIVVAVPPPALERFFNEIELGSDGIIALARADGSILARVARPGAVRRSIGGSPGLGAGPAEGNFRSAATVDGAERLFAYRKLESYPLTVFVAQGIDTVLSAYYGQRNALLAAGAVASLLLLAVALLLISRGEERARVLDERERLLLELHDGSIQSIYAIGLSLENCRRLLEKAPAQAARALDEAGANLNLVIQDLRAFISGERKAAPTEPEFMAEIERMLPQSGPPFTVEVDRTLIAELSAEESAHCLRIAREAVSNIVRHARASSASLSLQRRGEAICLEVSDDGIGVAVPAEGPGGLGLHHIRARARKLRGRATVQPGSPKGTLIAVEFPRHGRA
jgi:signal transduction histidine kinase